MDPHSSNLCCPRINHTLKKNFLFLNDFRPLKRLQNSTKSSCMDFTQHSQFINYSTVIKTRTWTWIPRYLNYRPYLNFTSFSSNDFFPQIQTQDPMSHLVVLCLLSILWSMITPQAFLVFHDTELFCKSQLFCRLSLKLGLLGVSSWLDSNDTFWARLCHRSCSCTA